MKYIAYFAAAVLLAASFGTAQALASDGGTCRQKEQAVERQLEIARQHGNSGKGRGLEKALANVRLWCSDNGLLAKAEEKIAQKREKVQEREKELAEAVSAGKGQEKISRRKQKLDQANDELLEAVRERDSLLKSIQDAGE
mgnify:FL=1